jgi:hypothetical protein
MADYYYYYHEFKYTHSFEYSAVLASMCHYKFIRRLHAIIAPVSTSCVGLIAIATKYCVKFEEKTMARKIFFSQVSTIQLTLSALM